MERSKWQTNEGESHKSHINGNVLLKTALNHEGNDQDMTGDWMGISSIVLGVILLVLGRKLFWLFVSIVGFLFGMGFSGLVFPDQPEWIRVLFALGMGFFGALLTVLAQLVAFAIAGFYGGFYFALILAQSFGVGGNNIALFTGFGVIGAVSATLIMDWVIIVLSCLVGAGAVVEASGLGQEMRVIVFLLLVITGAFIQIRLLPHSKADSKMSHLK